MLERKFYNKSRAEWVAVLSIDGKEIIVRALSEKELDKQISDVMKEVYC